MPKILILVGSLRAGSINNKLGHAIARLSPPGLKYSFSDLSSLPLYNEDLWSSPPSSVLLLKETINSSDAVLFVTPEHNRSLPAALKNAIDWGSRPKGKNSWADKPCAIIGASPGSSGAAVAQAHLRSVMTSLGAFVIGTPEVCISYTEGLIDDNHGITNQSTNLFLASFVDRFSGWIDRTGTSQLAKHREAR